MLGLANVMKGSTVTIAQVNFQTCNRKFADQNIPIKYQIFPESCKLIFLVFDIYQKMYRFEQKLNTFY